MPPPARGARCLALSYDYTVFAATQGLRNHYKQDRCSRSRGGGLGVYTPEEVGPMSSPVPNGVVDILVEDEAEAVRVAKQHLSYFQGPVDDWEAPVQRHLRHIIPENRVRMYDMREIIRTLADEGSVLEIRRDFGIGILAAACRPRHRQRERSGPESTRGRESGAGSGADSDRPPTRSRARKSLGDRG